MPLAPFAGISGGFTPKGLAANLVTLKLPPSQGDDEPTEALRRLAAEAAAARRLERELQRQARQLAAAGEEPAQIRAAIDALGGDASMREVLDYVLAQGTDLGVSIAVDQLAGAGIRFDYRLVNEEARRWAQNYSYELVRGIDATTQRVLQTEFEAWTRTGEPYSALVRRIAPTFGRERAKLIATTETTRAYAEGSMAIYQASGVVVGVEWLTAGDKGVCKICAPLDSRIFPLAGLTKPPLHPGCRCALAPRVPEPEELEAGVASGRYAVTLDRPAKSVSAPAAPVPTAPVTPPALVEVPAPIPAFTIPAPPALPPVEVAPVPAPVALPYQPTRGQLTTVAKHVNQQVRNVAEEYGLTPKTVERTIDRAFTQLTAESRMAIQFESKYVDSLLKDGRFKTQFETRTSGGTNSPSYRATAEQRGLGTPKDIDPKQRPIYGYFDLGPSARGMVSQYGDLTFVVKDEVKGRATVTAGDSLYNFATKQVAGTPVTAPTKASWDTAVEALYDYGSGLGDSSQLVGRLRYVEVQMHGGVSLADMRAVVDRRGVLTAVQRKALQERGIEVWDN
ncbi:MAG: DUF3626 domain-containing protein [Hyphomicrobiaceae bacterium]|nr:MAG: DUF3626 domain-containing protein [Hyphomicrobiaceae bacterium]